MTREFDVGSVVVVVQPEFDCLAIQLERRDEEGDLLGRVCLDVYVTFESLVSDLSNLGFSKEEIDSSLEELSGWEDIQPETFEEDGDGDNCVEDMNIAINRVVEKMDKEDSLSSANSLLLTAKLLEDWANTCIDMAYDGRSKWYKDNPRKRDDELIEVLGGYGSISDLELCGCEHCTAMLNKLKVEDSEDDE